MRWGWRCEEQKRGCGFCRCYYPGDSSSKIPFLVLVYIGTGVGKMLGGATEKVKV